jgi:hypothetical protein
VGYAGLRGPLIVGPTGRNSMDNANETLDLQR